MTLETTQPFAEQPPRHPDDSQLVEKVLGTQEADEMRELTGGQATPDQTSEDLGQLELTKDEDAATTEAEKSNIEKRREEYTKWAKDIGEDEDFVDEVFVFHSDGTVEAPEGIRLRNLDLSTGFPSNLVKIDGDLDLSYTGFNNFDFLKRIVITGDLWLLGCDIDEEKYNSLDLLEGRIFD